MWRLTATVIRNLGQKLLSLQNSPHQVLFKPLNSSPWVSNFISRKFPHQNHRFFALSSISEVKPETHDASSSFLKDLKMETGGVLDGTSVTEINSSKWNDALELLKNNVDESLESTLDSMDLCLDEEFVLGLLKDSLFPEKHLIRFLNWVSSKKDFRVTTSILGYLGYRCRTFHDMIDAYALWELVKEIGEKYNGVLNAKILNDFLVTFYCLRNVKSAFEVYGKFEEFGCTPDEMTYYWTIKTLCELFAYDEAISVCQKMLDTEMLPWNGVFDIISLLCKGDRAKEAHAVYMEVKKSDKYNRSVLLRHSQSEVVECLAKVDETVHLAQELLLLGHTSFEKVQLLWVIRGLCRKNDFEGAKELFFKMIKKDREPLNGVFECLIECLSRAGDLEGAREIFKLAKRKNWLKINTYEVLMSGYAKVGLVEEACEVLLAAKKEYPKLCPVGLHAFIQGYCKVGEFEKALKLFLELKNHGVIPNVDEYNMLIQLLSLCLKNLDREIAHKFREKMREENLYLPHITESLVRESIGQVMCLQ